MMSDIGTRNDVEIFYLFYFAVIVWILFAIGFRHLQNKIELRRKEF